jgi:hypothetical protein
VQIELYRLKKAFELVGVARFQRTGIKIIMFVKEPKRPLEQVQIPAVDAPSMIL